MIRFICIAAGVCIVQFIIEKLRGDAGSDSQEKVLKVQDFPVKILEVFMMVGFIMMAVLPLFFGFTQETLQVVAVSAGGVVMIGCPRLMIRRIQLIIREDEIIYTPPIGPAKTLKIAEIGKIETTKLGDIKIYNQEGKKFATVDFLLTSHQDLVGMLSRAGDMLIDGTEESN